jgi:hypothetical protein
MTRRFGLGFEIKSGISPSTWRARAFFLELLPQLKQEVVSALFGTARQPFIEYLTHSREEILSIDANIDSSNVPADTAVRIFTYGWSSLQRQKRAAALRSALRKWGAAWNLADDWCMDHAVAVLREQYLNTLNASEAWHEATVFELKLGSICVQGAFNLEFSERGLDKFYFKYEGVDFAIEGPMFTSVPEFKQEVEQRFKAAGGPYIRGARTALKHRLNDYLGRVYNIAKEQNYTEPPIRLAEDHFEWLVRYQISPVMRYREIGKAYGKNEKTIREGVKDVATLVGLTLRSSGSDQHLGRPRGARDKTKRVRRL